jgi:predicted phage terminase large subunit-like protein
MSAAPLTVLCLPAIAPADAVIPIGDGRVHRRNAGEALHPERESLATLAAMRAQMGELVFSAQYLLHPVPPDGWIIRWEWFQWYDELHLLGGVIIQSWDTAFKTGANNDYSVCTTWLYLDGRSYLLDVFRERLEFPDLNRLLPEHAGKWMADEVIIEDTGTGTALIQAHRSKWDFLVLPNIPRGDKENRLRVETPAIEAGNVFLKRGAPWIDALKDEVTKFPRGKHDDIVDSLSQYLKRVRIRGFPRSTFTPIGGYRHDSRMDLPSGNGPGGLYI